MSEPLRTAPGGAPVADTEREALIERLLLAGLDHYFDGRYEQAVNVWTRVAFLERGHGRARAYIERARGALAERQRRTEEIVHRGVAAYEAGDLQTARQLLTDAVADGSTNETALIFLQRLARLDEGDRMAARAGAVPPRPAHAFREAPAPTPATPVATDWFSTAAASILLAGGILLAAQPIASWLGERPIAAPVVESQAAEPLPIVRASDVRVARARALYENGRLREALRLLDTIDLADPQRPHADRMKSAIQRDLLATISSTPSSSAGETPR